MFQKLLWRNKDEAEDSSLAHEESLTSSTENEITLKQHEKLSNDDDIEEYLEENVEESLDCLDMEWRTVIFIRHGNSIWNESTDHSFKNPYFAAKALSAFTSGVKEYYKLKWSASYKHEDSLYVDTPLSPKGMKQAYNLSLFLKHHQQQRDEEKLIYLKQHQTINSSIKDAWRALQQHKMERIESKQSYNKLCDDALSSLTEAMQSVESLMANAKPLDPQHNKLDHNNVPINIQSILDILIGKNIPSKIVCSNLRRAISTTVLSLWNRLRFSTEKIYILSCLQEIGINVDTHTQTEQFQVPQVSNFEMMTENLDAKALNDFYSKRIETIYNYGDKVNNSFLMESEDDTLKRIQLFAKWIFMEQHDGNDPDYKQKENVSLSGFKTVKTNKIDKNNEDKKELQCNVPPAVIAVGHSSWIKAFFNQYLPANFEFIGKETKLSNCGVIGFKFYFNKNTKKYGIAPNTITVAYKGFGAS